MANEYGHTETSVANVINRRRRVRDHARSIDRAPDLEHRGLLLDEHLAVPVGVTGELYAGWRRSRPRLRRQPGPDRGQIRGQPVRPRPPLPQRRPRPVPPDGRLEFVGRTDHQVKVRGYRIELGEIEGRAGRRPRRPRGGRGGPRRRPRRVRRPSTVDADALRAHLSERLPEYMVPATLTTLDTPAADVQRQDRPGRPARAGRGAVSTSGVLPRDELEMALAKLWEDLLGRRVGVTDGFFDVGGHSLLAVVLVDRIKAELGATVGLAEVFRAPAIRALADLIRGEDHGGDWSCPSLSPAPVSRRCSCCRRPPGAVPRTCSWWPRTGPALPVFGLRAPGFAPGKDPVHTIEELAAAFVADLLPVAGDRPIPLAGWSQGGSAWRSKWPPSWKTRAGPSSTCASSTPPCSASTTTATRCRRSTPATPWRGSARPC